jgi:hypothetical protein
MKMSNVVTELIDDLLNRFTKNDSNTIDVLRELIKIGEIAHQHSQEVANIHLKQNEEIARFKRLYEEAIRVSEEVEQDCKEELDELKKEIATHRTLIQQWLEEKKKMDELIYLQSEFILRKKRENEEAWD